MIKLWSKITSTENLLVMKRPYYCVPLNMGIVKQSVQVRQQSVTCLQRLAGGLCHVVTQSCWILFLLTEGKHVKGRWVSQKIWKIDKSNQLTGDFMSMPTLIKRKVFVFFKKYFERGGIYLCEVIQAVKFDCMVLLQYKHIWIQ